MHIELQAKLLRALQEREVERLGGTRTIPVDVRVIAASNIDLREATRARAFREDLFYRLNAVPLSVPPLRARKDDIPLLVDHFVKKYAREFKKDVWDISRSALPALTAYNWPGNVRELENMIERSVALATHPVLQMEDLPFEMALQEQAPGGSDRELSPPTLKEARERGTECCGRPGSVRWSRSGRACGGQGPRLKGSASRARNHRRDFPDVLQADLVPDRDMAVRAPMKALLPHGGDGDRPVR